MIARLLHVMVLLAGLAAAPASASLTFSLRTGEDSTKTQSMAIDSNQCPARGPIAAYVGGLITNTGPGTVTSISASLTGLGNGFFLAGGQPLAQSLGALAPGESVGVYWFVGYGCTDGATTLPSVAITSSLGSQSTPVTLVGREAISANAGGNVQSATLGPGAVVGQTIYFDASYSFGGSEVLDEFILQPSGGQAFNAGCFRLVGSTITASTIAGMPVGTQNRLYFRQTAKQTGTGYTATVRYHFQYLCAGTSSQARPYAIQTSGSSNIKYTGNFDGTGSISLSFPGATNPFTIVKSVSSDFFISGPTNSVTYTVTVSNPSAHATTVSSFTDTLPAGATYAALAPGSGVTLANSSSTPAAGATGTITFTGKVNQSYALPGGGSVSLIYTATIPGAAGTYVNTAQASLGSATTPTAQATVNVVTPIPLSVTKVSAAHSDPINGATDPLYIPGGVVGYTILVQNQNGYPADADSVIVADPTPSGLALVVVDFGAPGGGPVSFTDGGTSSTLTYAFSGLSSMTDDVDFSNDGGATWTYVPVPDGDGVDPAVNRVRIRPRGAMAANSSFSLQFRYRID